MDIMLVFWQPYLYKMVAKDKNERQQADNVRYSDVRYVENLIAMESFKILPSYMGGAHEGRPIENVTIC